MPEQRQEDPTSFFNFLRVPPEMFDELVARLSPRCTKQDTNYRKAIEPVLKIAIAMRHLASGDKYASMMFDFRFPHNTMSVVAREVCQVIVEEYKNEVISCPITTKEWRPIAEQFKRRWNVSHACAALDGKHVAWKKPSNTEILYYNYKGFCSIVLMALLDADHKFLWVDVRGHGHMSDAQIFNESELKECLEHGTIGLTSADHMPNDDKNMKYFFIAVRTSKTTCERINNSKSELEAS